MPRMSMSPSCPQACGGRMAAASEAATGSPTKARLMKMSGNSQNFFLIFRNLHNSLSNSIAPPSEWIPETLGRERARIAPHPVGQRARLEASLHQIAPAQPHQQAHGREHAEEQQSQQQRTERLL